MAVDSHTRLLSPHWVALQPSISPPVLARFLMTRPKGILGSSSSIQCTPIKCNEKCIVEMVRMLYHPSHHYDHYKNIEIVKMIRFIVIMIIIVILVIIVIMLC